MGREVECMKPNIVQNELNCRMSGTEVQAVAKAWNVLTKYSLLTSLLLVIKLYQWFNPEVTQNQLLLQ